MEIFTFMKINKIFFILILAIILRFIYINHTPALNPDEAALGYNAYSFKTGKDEHGTSFFTLNPLVITSQALMSI